MGDYSTIKKEISPWGTYDSGMTGKTHPLDNQDQFSDEGRMPSITKFDRETGHQEYMDYIISRPTE